MEPITLDELKTFATSLDGQTLTTKYRDRPFTLHVSDVGFEYTPHRSSTPRLQRWRWIERVLARFNEGRSFHPADYRDISKNASYLLAILGTYHDSVSTASAVE